MSVRTMKKVVGLRITDHSIELVGLKKKGKRVLLLGLANASLPDGVVVHGRIMKDDLLKESVATLFEQARPHSLRTHQDIVFIFPDTQVYTHFFTVAHNEFGYYDNAVKKEIMHNIPIDDDDLAFSYTILSESPKEDHVFVIATHQSLLVQWQRFFAALGKHVRVFDIEALALFRSMFYAPTKSPICFVNLEKQSIQMNIFDSNGLRYTHRMHMPRILLPHKGKRDSTEAKETKKQKRDAALMEIIEEIRQVLTLAEKNYDLHVEELFLFGKPWPLRRFLRLLRDTFAFPIVEEESRFADVDAHGAYHMVLGTAMKLTDKQWIHRDPHFFPVDPRLLQRWK